MNKINPQIFKIIGPWLEYKWKLNELPSLSVGITQNNKILYKANFGKSTSLSTYRIASISKTFTALGILQLQEKGKLKLSDPVCKYIPEFVNSPKKNKITIRQILNHTSLITRDGSFEQWETGKFPSKKELYKEQGLTGIYSIANAKWKYSNIGYSYLGLIIEAVSGLSYERYMQKHILQPLGMKNTSAELTSSVKKHLLKGRVPKLPGKSSINLGQFETHSMQGATGFTSNIEDLLKYVNAIINRHKKLLKQNSWGIAFKTQWKHGSDYRNLFLTGTDNNKLIGHGGSFPGFTSRILMDIKNKTGVVVLINQNPAPLNSYGSGIYSIINGSAKLEKDLSKFKSKPKNPARFEGRFENLWGHVQIVEFQGQLIAFDLTNESPMHGMALLEYKNGNIFIIHDQDGYGAHGEPVEFLFVKNKLVGLNWAGHPHKLTI